MKERAAAAKPKRRVTIVDVAERAGVAISSVSSALNNRPGVSEQTRERIHRAAAELGFTPSLRGKSLSGKRAYAVDDFVFYGMADSKIGVARLVRTA